MLYCENTHEKKEGSAQLLVWLLNHGVSIDKQTLQWMETAAWRTFVHVSMVVQSRCCLHN